MLTTNDGDTCHLDLWSLLEDSSSPSHCLTEGSISPGFQQLGHDLIRSDSGIAPIP